MGRLRRVHRKPLLTALVAAVVGAVVGTGTYAAFTVQTGNDGLFATGTVQISDDDTGSALFDVSGMKPGDPPISRCIRVTYTGSLNAHVRLYGSSSGTLAQYLNLTVTRGSGPQGDTSCGSFSADSTNHIGQGAGVVYAGTLAGYPATFGAGIVDPTPGSPEVWTTSESHSYRFTVSVQDVAESHGASATAELSWEARNTFEGVYGDEVMADSPVAHWRLGDAVMRDDFETFGGWTDYGSGTFAQSSEQSRTGTSSGRKDSNNDPNGGEKPLGSTIGNEWKLETWLYRPSPFTGGSENRVGLENGSYNGYSFSVAHNSNELKIDRRTSGSATNLATLTLDPPENTWYRAVLERSGSSLTFTVYHSGGAELGQVTATDSTYSSFDRVVVRGGHQYYVDDLTVTVPGSGVTATDSIGAHDGTYTGGVTMGVPGLLRGDPDTAVSVGGSVMYVEVPDHPALDFAGTAPMSVEAWVKPSSVDSSCRRIVSKEINDASGTQGYLLYYCNDRFAFQRRRDGTHHTVVSPDGRAVAGVASHVVGTYDGTTMRLYVDGAEVGTPRTSAIGLVDHANSMRIGSQSGGGLSLQAEGVLDEVAVYGTALSASRIAAHYQAGAGP